MSELRGWVLPEQHLLPDAVVAYVDNELPPVARDRVASHLGRCPICAAETAAQQQARAAVRAADAPSAPATLLAALRSIPVDTDLPGGPDQLGVTAEGEFVAIQRTDRGGPLLGSSRRLGTGSALLRRGGHNQQQDSPGDPRPTRPTGHRHRAVQGAGVVAAGLVLGALAVVGPHVFGQHVEPSHGDNPPGSDVDVIQANFGAPARPRPTAPPSTSGPAAAPTVPTVPAAYTGR